MNRSLRNMSMPEKAKGPGHATVEVMWHRVSSQGDRLSEVC